MSGPRDTLDSDMFTTEDRWERIAAGLFWTGWLFVVFTAHAIYSRDDWRAIAMTAAPAAILFAGWYLARARAEYLLTTAKPPRALRIGGWVVIGAGLFALVYQWSNPRVVYVDPPAFQMQLSDHAMNQLTGRLHPTPLCEEWAEAEHPTVLGEPQRYCARWAPQAP